MEKCYWKSAAHAPESVWRAQNVGIDGLPAQHRSGTRGQEPLLALQRRRRL